jgi:hypothetical protein
VSLTAEVNLLPVSFTPGDKFATGINYTSVIGGKIFPPIAANFRTKFEIGPHIIFKGLVENDS